MESISLDSMAEILHEGGLVLVAIGVVSVVAWTLLFWKWAWLRAQSAAHAEIAHDPALASRSGTRVAMDMWVSGESGRLEDGLGPIQVLAALLPLLGLLGTVLGMLDTFEVIKAEGTGDPRLMAHGIRKALLTTQAGILAAVPVLLALRYLTSRAQRLISRVELDSHRAIRAGNGHVAAHAGGEARA
jgi:biopolymer transport protein ExbB